MNKNVMFSTEVFYQEANIALKQQDLVEFVSKISKAEAFALNESKYLPQITLLKVKGLFKFNQYKKTLECIPEALQYNTGEEELLIRNYEGVVKGYLGDFESAKNIFFDLTSKVKNTNFLVEIYLNIVWIYWSMYNIDKQNACLNEVKVNLDLANTFFDSVSNNLKGKILTGYSSYLFKIGNFDEAIQQAERSLVFFDEEYHAKAYNNLTAMYLEMDSGEPVNAQEYLKKAELLGEKYNNNLEIGKTFYNKAMFELRQDQLFSALDALYMSFEYYKEAGAMTLAFECLVKITEILNEYKIERLNSLKDTMKGQFKDTMLYDKL